MAELTDVLNVSGIRTSVEASPIPIRGQMNIDHILSPETYSSSTSLTAIPIRGQMNINQIKNTTWNTLEVGLAMPVSIRQLVKPSMTSIYSTRVGLLGKLDFSIVKVFGDDPVREFWL